MNVYPKTLKLLTPERLQITWNDEVEQVLTVRQLRAHCPCATCREVRRGEAAQTNLLPILRVEETQPLRIHGMQPVGNYAYSIAFSDGHDTGIFTLEFLRQLGDELTSQVPRP